MGESDESSDDEHSRFRVQEEDVVEDVAGDDDDDDTDIAGGRPGEYRPLTSTLTSLMRTVHNTVKEFYPQEASLPEDSGEKLRYDAQRKEWVMIS